MLEKAATYSTLRVRGRNLQTQLPSVSSESEEDMGPVAINLKLSQIPAEPELSRLEEKWVHLDREIGAASVETIPVPEVPPQEERTENETSVEEIIQGVGQLDKSLANIEGRFVGQPDGSELEIFDSQTSLGKYGNFSEQEDTLKVKEVIGVKRILFSRNIIILYCISSLDKTSLGHYYKGH